MSQSRAILKREAPDVVVGVGGYASGPMVLAAALGGRPTAILEQNSVPGFTNKTLGRFVKLVFGAFEAAREVVPAKKYRLVGNPVRKHVRDVLAAAQGGDGDGVLVVGGSQGAHAVNELVFDAMRDPARRRAGAAARAPDRARTIAKTSQRRYAEAGIAADVRAFIDDMARRLSRRGRRRRARRRVDAGRADDARQARAAHSVSVAADDHQTVNARELADAGAARLLAQATTTPAELADDDARRSSTIGDAPRRCRQASRALGRPQAHVEIADAIEALAPTR